MWSLGKKIVVLDMLLSLKCLGFFFISSQKQEGNILKAVLSHRYVRLI